MFRVKGFVVNGIEDLLPIFNENAEVTATALNIIGKRVSKLSRKMKLNDLVDIGLWLSLCGTVYIVGGMLKQIDIQKRRIDLLEDEIEDLNAEIYTKDKDEEM